MSRRVMLFRYIIKYKLKNVICDQKYKMMTSKFPWTLAMNSNGSLFLLQIVGIVEFGYHVSK